MKTLNDIINGLDCINDYSSYSEHSKWKKQEDRIYDIMNAPVVIEIDGKLYNIEVSRGYRKVVLTIDKEYVL